MAADRLREVFTRRFLSTDVGSVDRALALMAVIGAALQTVATAPDLVLDLTVGRWWLRVGTAVMLALFVGAAIGCSVMPVPRLRWLLRSVALAGSALTVLWAFTTDDPTREPWIYVVYATLVAFASAGWHWRGAMIYLVVTTLFLPMLSWLHVVDLPVEISHSVAFQLSCLGFVALFQGVRHQLELSWDVAEATVAQQESLARTRAELAERERIGVFLHDEVLTSLLAISSATGDDPTIRLQTQHTLNRLQQELEGLPIGGTRDLAEALTLCAGRWMPAAVLDLTGPVDVPADVAEILMTAASEAMRNSVRHAGKGVDHPVLRWVTLADDGNTVALEVGDDGCGFDVAAIDTQRLGVNGSIMGRMERLDGGSAVFESVRPSGTRVLLRWRRP